MPEHAQRIVNRLIGVHDEYTTIGELRADLNATVEQPMEVGPANRGTQLALQAAFLLPGLLLMFLPGVILPDLWGGGARANDLAPSDTYDRVAWTAVGAAVAWPLAWAVWAFLAGGGLSYSMTGIALVNAAGCRASRFCCLVRALMVWTPVALLLVSTYWWPSWFDIPQTPAMFRLCWLSCWAIIAAILAVYAMRALMSPLRAVHDRVADVYLVPQ